MAKSKLFDSWTFQLPYPAPFDDKTAVAKTHSDIGSRHNLATAAQSTLHAPTLRAILAYLNLKNGTGTGAVGFQNNDLINAEYDGATHYTAVVYNRQKGKFFAAIYDVGSDVPKPYTLASKGETGSALIFTLMSIFLEDEEFAQAFAEFERLIDQNDLLALTKEAALLCDNVYRRILAGDSLPTAGIKLDIPTTGNITQLTALMLDEGIYAPNQLLYGNFAKFQLEMGGGTAPGKMANQGLEGAYKLSDKVYSEEEQKLIPMMEEWYVVSEEVIDICEHIKSTSDFNRPVRNVMLRGDSGVGKTEAAKAVAAGLQIPYYALTCHPNMEIYDLIGQMLPVDRGSSSETMIENEMPSFDDLIMDPATVMSMVTGNEYDESITADDALNALIEAKSRSGEGQQFHFVKSPLIKALETGAVIEIQEPTVINDPGVLAGLNSLLDAGQMITLPTGDVVRRDPNSIVVMTTNVGYAGCKMLNQSIISRMQLIIDMQEPSFEDIVQRVLNVSGCTDEEMVRNMTTVYWDMKQHCREKIIQDGSVGIRELIDWVESYMVTKKAYKSALYTIVPSASADEESRQDLIDTCLTPRIHAEVV